MKRTIFSLILLTLCFSLTNTYAQSSNKKKNKSNKEVNKKEGGKDGIQPYGKVIKKSAISDNLRNTLFQILNHVL